MIGDDDERSAGRNGLQSLPLKIKGYLQLGKQLIPEFFAAFVLDFPVQALYPGPAGAVFHEPNEGFPPPGIVGFGISQAMVVVAVGKVGHKEG